MNFIAVIVALGLEQWRTFKWRSGIQHAFVRYAWTLERRFNAGTMQQGAIAALLALVPPVVIVAGIYWALDWVHPLLGLLWNVTVVYLLVAFRHFSHAFAAVGEALRSGDAVSARR